jgi:hypothetical protein
MKESEAVRVVATLAGYYGRELGDDVALLWARELTGWEFVDGLEAARMLAELISLTREAKRERLERGAAALPAETEEGVPLAEFIRDNPELGERLGKTGWFREVARRLGVGS